jgi:hypothetical protein
MKSEKTEKQKNDEKATKVALGLTFLIFTPLWWCSQQPSKEADNGCYERTGAEIGRREGNKPLSKSDLEQYYRELRYRCG